MRVEAALYSDATDPAHDTLSARAERLLERDILSGALVPGARLGIAELVARYAISATPIREALSRLVPRGLIIALNQRGFRVASVGEDDLIDITMNRVLVETEALRRSMRHGGAEWEANALAALHRLQRHIEQEPGWRKRDEEFDRLHKAFHTALIAGCGLRTHADDRQRSLRSGVPLSPPDDGIHDGRHFICHATS